jgi:hypothetical protein
MDVHVASTLSGHSLIWGVAAGDWTVINAPHSMSTSHPPNAYTSSYQHQLASQPHYQPPPSSYQHQPYPTNNHHPQPPLQIARSGSRDSTSSDQPSPNRDGRDSYANREKREAWDTRLERKTRPATIAELADKSREDLWDPNRHLKHWLRTAELARKSGKQYADSGDYERSFIQLARAASIILEKMPTHKDYHTLLTSSQRNNLVLVSLYLLLSQQGSISHFRSRRFQPLRRFIFASVTCSPRQRIFPNLVFKYPLVFFFARLNLFSNTV